jgi:hypothetical protein
MRKGERQITKMEEISTDATNFHITTDITSFTLFVPNILKLLW